MQGGDKVEKLQGEYRDVAQACYRLGYRKQVLRFQEFLKNAKEWYGIFARYLSAYSYPHCTFFLLTAMPKQALYCLYCSSL